MGFERLCKRVGIVGACAHDIRRTVASGLARLKVAPHVLSLVLNHVKKASDITMAVYVQHSFDDEKKAAMSLWEEHLRKILGLTGDNVATFA